MDYKLENKFISYEMRLVNDRLISGEIANKRSGDTFIPDGNTSHFTIALQNGESISSKAIIASSVECTDSSIKVSFEELYGFTCHLEFTLGENDHFFRKQLSFDCTSDEVVDYIDLASWGIMNVATKWSAPDMADAVGGVDGYYSTLGQPIYLDSFFIGCEFPATDNKIETVARVRYYKGESFNKKSFSAPKTVFGAARSCETEILNQDFLSYIETISTKSDFRIQYNSWYDHMLNITAENIEKSFYEIEKNLSKIGIPPIDAYVVDDGWVDYKADFWKFNSKFPNELYDSSALAKKFNSEFGLWLGPRGGYSFQSSFGKRMEKAGTGNYNPSSRDICVGSEAYLDNLLKLFIDYMDRFDIGYWKLDGFINSPCKKTTHNHITGGHKQMYFMTQTWERWIDIFAKMRNARQAVGKDLWINMTCYVNPSPWWLQWVNTVWMQNSTDIGFAKNVSGQSQVEQMLTYRDDKYFDFLQTRCHRFPLKSIYNHEPIYGNTAKINFTDDEFEKYLFMIATRGTAFWELYYSYNMMNENKWDSTARVLKWAKANYHILQNARLIGETPAKNKVYGYSCFTEDEGILSLRNPSDKKTIFTVKLDNLFGVKESMKNLNRYNVFNKTANDESNVNFSYGDSFTVELDPFEVKIFQFGENDNRFCYADNCNDFTFKFTPNSDCTLLNTEDVSVIVENGKLVFTAGNTQLTPTADVIGKEVCLVREKNGMLKAYIDASLECSSYSEPEKLILEYKTDSQIQIIEHGLSYDDIMVQPKVKKGLFARIFNK